MPGVSKETASDTMNAEGYEGHYENFDGGYTVAFETFTQDMDPEAMFKGLPDDRCQCPHWGYVLKGKVSYKTADGEVTFQEGEAYYVPPGHTPVGHAGSETVEFSPTDELHKTIEVAMKNMEAANA
jgi:glyoxylate utilization-related uncharacterized protein